MTSCNGEIRTSRDHCVEPHRLLRPERCGPRPDIDFDDAPSLALTRLLLGGENLSSQIDVFASQGWRLSAEVRPGKYKNQCYGDPIPIATSR